MMNSKNSSKGSDIVTKAFGLARMLHEGQYRKGPDRIPYLVHPMKVATILLKYKQQDYVIAAGFLHDIVEDTGCTLERLSRSFPDEVIRLVRIATELDRNHPWKERKMHTIEAVKRAEKDEKILVCADKLANITDMIYDYQRVGETLWDRFLEPLPDKRKKKELIKWYYLSMFSALHSKPSIGNLNICKDYGRAVKRLFGK